LPPVRVVLELVERRRSDPQRKRTIMRPTTRPDDGNAFLPDPRDGTGALAEDDLAELLAESFLCSATSGEEEAEAARDRIVPEESGGLVLREPDEDDVLPPGV
jgi:hypothetical protein